MFFSSLVSDFIEISSFLGKNDGGWFPTGWWWKLRRKRLDQDQASQLLAESSGDRSGGHLVGNLRMGGLVAAAIWAFGTRV